MAKHNKEVGNFPPLRFHKNNKEWVRKKIGEISSISSGGTPSRGKYEFWGGNIPWITTSLIDFNEIQRAEEYITKEGLNQSSAKLFPKGTILMAMYGQGKTRGKVAILGIEATTNQACAAIKVKQGMDARFLYTYLEKEYDRIRNIANDGGQQNLSASLIKSYKISLPNLNEQVKISSFLLLIDRRINTQIKIIEELQSQKNSLSKKLLSCQVRFLEHIEKWKEVKIGDVVKIGSGKDYKHLAEGEVPVFGTGGYMTSVDSCLYEGETVCIGRKGTIDKPFYYNGKIWTVDTLFFTHSYKSILPRFLFYVFEQINWLKFNEASGVPSLSKSTIEKIAIKIPSVKEQQKITTTLFAIDQKIDLESKHLELLKQQKRYFLQNLFI
ncbi:restriction endonuclease subunit S [Echinicola rosea]|uniref:Type I restriction modification DNA specificity domain-containing protein n=1 Tax=Echinicola rosea TaxID=1807691 RepID=A0ABQ1V7R8_9BACT|nr:restriction endonuclease subunit S [Echinicola rosea]GGF43077.1 hypothetical protein GCM10011339_34470 [Echinicola rosea]